MKAKFLFVLAALLFSLSAPVYARDTQPIKGKFGKIITKSGTPVQSRTKNFHRG